MKVMLRSVFAALAGLLYSGALLAQTSATVPNGTFETWALRNGNDAPQNWQGTDDIIRLSPQGQLVVPTATVTKSSGAHGGAFAAQVQNVAKSTVLGNLILPGYLLLGSRVNPNGNGNVGGGVAYTSRPTRLQFWYKLTGTNITTDSAAAIVSLVKTLSSTTTETVAYGAVLLKQADNYTLLDLPLTYYQTYAPDTLEMLLTSGLADKITQGTTLTVDDITLTGTITAARNPTTEAALQIYPNPSRSGEFSLASLSSPALSTAPFTVADITGREVLRQAAAPLGDSRGRLVDLRGQRPGLYTLRLQTPDGPVVRKLVID